MYNELRCPICHTLFNQSTNIPKILPECGDTICSECLLFAKNRPIEKCPLDNKSFVFHRQSNDLPTNELLLTVIKQLHQNQSFIRTVDSIDPSSNTSFAMDNDGEEMAFKAKSIEKYINAIETEYNAYLTKITTNAKEYSQLKTQINSSYSKTKEQISQFYNDLRECLMEKEIENLNEIDVYYHKYLLSGIFIADNVSKEVDKWKMETLKVLDELIKGNRIDDDIDYSLFVANSELLLNNIGSVDDVIEASKFKMEALEIHYDMDLFLGNFNSFLKLQFPRTIMYNAKTNDVNSIMQTESTKLDGSFTSNSNILILD